MILQRCTRQLYSGVRGVSITPASQKSDLISDVFLKQIRELAEKQKAPGGLVNSNPEYKKQLEEQLNRLAQKFKLPNSDIVGKLDVQFEKANVESSVNTLLEGKTLDQMIAEEQKNYDKCFADYEAAKKAEQKRLQEAANPN